MKIKDIQIGETYNSLLVLDYTGVINGKSTFKCKCLECGNPIGVSIENIGRQISCKLCSRRRSRLDLTGKRVGRLTVIGRAANRSGRTYWECKCDCGNTATIQTSGLTGNRPTQSCGCLQKEATVKATTEKSVILKRSKYISSNFDYGDNAIKHPLRKIWMSMRQRCNNPNAANYHLYGGRGIKVCDRWNGDNGFENFVNDMGERPTDKHSIDRIDVNRNYCPENCRWATRKEQENNKRNNNRVVLNGESITVSQLCETIAVNRNFIYQLLKRGVDINYILQVKLNSTKNEKHYTEHINFNRNIDNALINKFLIKIQHN